MRTIKKRQHLDIQKKAFYPHHYYPKMARTHGAKNYRRTLLMELVSEFLPNGHNLRKAVAAEYQRCSGESEERDPHEMEKYW